MLICKNQSPMPQPFFFSSYYSEEVSRITERRHAKGNKPYAEPALEINLIFVGPAYVSLLTDTTTC